MSHLWENRDDLWTKSPGYLGSSFSPTLPKSADNIKNRLCYVYFSLPTRRQLTGEPK